MTSALPYTHARVFISETWHPIGDRPHHLALLKRTLKPGGQLVIIDFQKEATEVGRPETGGSARCRLFGSVSSKAECPRAIWKRSAFMRRRQGGPVADDWGRTGRRPRRVASVLGERARACRWRRAPPERIFGFARRGPPSSNFYGFSFLCNALKVLT